jgi:hypothetical protein
LLASLGAFEITPHPAAMVGGGVNVALPAREKKATSSVFGDAGVRVGATCFVALVAVPPELFRSGGGGLYALV